MRFSWWRSGILGPGGALWITQLAEKHVSELPAGHELLFGTKVYTCLNIYMFEYIPTCYVYTHIHNLLYIILYIILMYIYIYMISLDAWTIPAPSMISTAGYWSTAICWVCEPCAGCKLPACG